MYRFGRTLEEYTKMFNLDDLTAPPRIISIADGPSTFNLEQRKRGIEVTSVDPIYNLEPDQLKEIFNESYIFNKNLFYENKLSFLFKNDEQIESLLTKRANTFNLFLSDYTQNRHFYQYGKLPDLKFATRSFDLCLCSNFLFIFDHIFDLDFHLEAIETMLAIADEVRIFPLYDINGKESKYLNAVKAHLIDKNFTWHIAYNDYHIYKDGNRLIKISREER